MAELTDEEWVQILLEAGDDDDVINEIIGDMIDVIDDPNRRDRILNRYVAVVENVDEDPNMGADASRGAGKTIIPVKLKKGELTKYGYHITGLQKKRRMALDMAIAEYSPISVLRKIVILRTFNKNNPKKFEKLDNDVKYIQRTYFKGMEGGTIFDILKSFFGKSKSKSRTLTQADFDPSARARERERYNRDLSKFTKKYGSGSLLGKGGVYLGQKHRTKKGLVGIPAPSEPVVVATGRTSDMPMDLPTTFVPPPIKPYGHLLEKGVPKGGMGTMSPRVYKRGGLALGQETKPKRRAVSSTLAWGQGGNPPKKGMMGATYGGMSKKQGFIRAMIAKPNMNKKVEVDLTKMKNPSKYMLRRYGKIIGNEEPQRFEEDVDLQDRIVNVPFAPVPPLMREPDVSPFAEPEYPPRRARGQKRPPPAILKPRSKRVKRLQEKRRREPNTSLIIKALQDRLSKYGRRYLVDEDEDPMEIVRELRRLLARARLQNRPMVDEDEEYDIDF